MNLSEWAENQLAIARNYRSLSQDNPVALSVSSGGQSFYVLVSFKEPGFTVPFNVIWVVAGEGEGTVLRRYSEDSDGKHKNGWNVLEVIDDVFAEPPIWRTQDLLVGEVERYGVGPASTEKAGIFRINNEADNVVSSSDERMSNAREPKEHTHAEQPRTVLQVGELNVVIGNSEAPNAGDVLVITRVSEGIAYGEWMKMPESDILYEGPWPTTLNVIGPGNVVDELTQVQFKAELVFDDGSVKAVNPKWEINDPTVGSISEDGIFHANSVAYNRVVRVTARYVHPETETPLAKSFTFTIRDIDTNLILASLEIQGQTELGRKEVASYVAIAHFTNGTSTPVSPDFWRVSNTEVGTITNAGIFTAAAVIGTKQTRITAMYSYKGVTKNAFVDVSVIDNTVYPASATILGPSIINENTSAVFELEVTYQNGRKQRVAVNDWYHTNQNAGKINAISGKFVAPNLNSNQTTTITASFTVGDVTIGASKEVLVVDTTIYPDKLTIEGPLFVQEGLYAQYSTVVHYSDGTSRPVKTLIGIESEDFATINPSGLLKAVPDVSSNVIVTLTAAYTEMGHTITASQDVTIMTTENIPVEAELLAPSYLKAGNSTKLLFEVVFLDGTRLAIRPDVWTLSNNNIATISADGMLVAGNVSQAATLEVHATFEASGQTVTASALVTINDADATPLSAKIIGPDSIPSTNLEYYTFEVRFNDGVVKKVEPIWVSSDPKIAAINSQGRVMPYQTGKVILTGSYTDSGMTVTATKEVTVV